MAVFSPDDVRAGAAEVVGRALHVRVREDGVEALAEALRGHRSDADVDQVDPARSPLDDEATTAAFIVALDAVNFGSGWFPVLVKRAGHSGYHHLARCLRDRYERAPFLALELAELTTEEVTALFEQPPNGAAADLMELYRDALASLGQLLVRRYDGRASALVEEAAGSARALVRLLQDMPMFRDASFHGGVEVPFLKRAQLTAADLSAALGGSGLGRFTDLHRLTMFADNLVPHVLRVDGVTAYDGHLLELVDEGMPLAPDSIEEVEVRAAAVHAVELLAARTGWHAHTVDHVLWVRGQGYAYRDGVSRRHRTRTWAY